MGSCFPQVEGRNLENKQSAVAVPSKFRNTRSDSLTKSSEAAEEAYVMIDAKGGRIDSKDCTQGMTRREKVSTAPVRGSATWSDYAKTRVTESMAENKDKRYWVADLKG